MNGILNILKPPGMTSHDVVSVVRRKLGLKKVGHTGTLDPNAAGVLPICVGQATKISQFLLDGEKKYRAELTLGLETDTQDIYGEIIKKSSVKLTKQEIETAIMSFVGSYEQLPPMYSAIKVNGKKLYDLARQGIEIERKTRKVNIISIDIIEINGNKILFDVKCSKGTYVRTLCKDIGDLLGCGGIMSFLIRTESSNFDLDTAVTIEELLNTEDVKQLFFPLDFPLKHMPSLIIQDSYRKQAENGNKIKYSYLVEEKDLSLDTKVRVYLEDEFIGFGIIDSKDQDKFIKFLRLFA